MSWKEYIARRTLSLPEAACKVQSGNRVVLGHAAGEPPALLQALTDRADELRDVEIFHLVTIGGEREYLKPGYEKHLRFCGNFLAASTRDAVAEGRADFRPVYFSEFPQLLRSPFYPVDVALVTVSRPNENGQVSLGVAIDYTRQAILSAKTAIAVINPKMPFLYGDAVMDVKDIDWFVADDTPLLGIPPSKVGPVEKAIGAHIASLINNGDCLQLGIGNIPDAVLEMLGDFRDLGIHSEMISDGVMRLAQKGVFNGSHHTIHPGKLVISFAMGSPEFYEWLDGNEGILWMTVDYINDPRVIGRVDNVVSINAALPVDLLGQVTAEALGMRQFSGAGGQVDFVRGAHFSKGGRSIIAMPSTAAGGKTSRICGAFGPGQAITTSRYDVEYIVTEHGIASLRWRSNRERMKALIAIAAPEFREDLAKQARDCFGVRVTP